MHKLAYRVENFRQENMTSLMRYGYNSAILVWCFCCCCSVFFARTNIFIQCEQYVPFGSCKSVSNKIRMWTSERASEWLCVCAFHLILVWADWAELSRNSWLAGGRAGERGNENETKCVSDWWCCKLKTATAVTNGLRLRARLCMCASMHVLPAVCVCVCVCHHSNFRLFTKCGLFHDFSFIISFFRRVHLHSFRLSFCLSCAVAALFFLWFPRRCCVLFCVFGTIFFLHHQFVLVVHCHGNALNSHTCWGIAVAEVVLVAAAGLVVPLYLTKISICKIV